MEPLKGGIGSEPVASPKQPKSQKEIQDIANQLHRPTDCRQRRSHPTYDRLNPTDMRWQKSRYHHNSLLHGRLLRRRSGSQTTIKPK